MACHLRSISLPSRPHSLEAKLEEELQLLSTGISSSSSSSETVYNSLRRLADAYGFIEEVTSLPSSRVGLSRPEDRKRVEEELERLLELLDLCSAIQENLSEMKTSIQDLQLALRRGGDHATTEAKLRAYIHSAKKAKNSIKKVVTKCVLGSPAAEDCNLTVVIKLLVQARNLSIGLLRSAPSLVLKQMALPNASKWSLISRAFQKRKLEFEEAQLQELEVSIEGLESGVELLFRRLIQSRVSLLNILSC